MTAGFVLWHEALLLVGFELQLWKLLLLPRCKGLRHQGVFRLYLIGRLVFHDIQFSDIQVLRQDLISIHDQVLSLLRLLSYLVSIIWIIPWECLFSLSIEGCMDIIWQSLLFDLLPAIWDHYLLLSWCIVMVVEDGLALLKDVLLIFYGIYFWVCSLQK